MLDYHLCVRQLQPTLEVYCVRLTLTGLQYCFCTQRCKSKHLPSTACLSSQVLCCPHQRYLALFDQSVLFLHQRAHPLVSSFLLKNLDYGISAVESWLPFRRAPSDFCPQFCSMTEAAAHVWLYRVWSWKPYVGRRSLTSHCATYTAWRTTSWSVFISLFCFILVTITFPESHPLYERSQNIYQITIWSLSACHTNRPPDRQYVADNGLAPQQWTFLLRWCVAP